MPFKGLNSKSYNKGDPFPENIDKSIRLYNMRFCPFAERTLLILALKGIPTEVININLSQRPEWFEAELNPLGKVPIFETAEGQIIYDSSICNEYLDTVYHEHKVLATDPQKRAAQRMLVERLSPLISLFYTALANLDKITKQLDVTENLLIDDYFGGSSPDFVDYQIWPWLERWEAIHSASQGKVPAIRAETHPKLAAYVRRMYSRPEVKAVARTDAEHKAFILMKVDGKFDYDYGL